MRSENKFRLTLCGWLLLLLLTGCTRPEHARQVLQMQGYQHIEITGYRAFGCDDSEDSDDDFHTGFKAMGPTGEQVTGVVCGATVRYD